MEENQPDLFEIRLNETGKFHIRKLSKIANFIYFFLIAESLVYLYTGITAVIKSSTLEATGKWEYFRINFYTWFSIVATIANVYGVYYYVKFFKRLSQSIDGDNEIMFNQSFKYIFRNAVVFFILMLINFASTVFFMIKK